MTIVKVEVCGVEGQGRNVTLAKQDAMRRIARILEMDYNPEYIVIRDQWALVYATPHGYNVVMPSEKSGKLYGHGHGELGPRDELVKATRLNLLQLTWTPADNMKHPEATEQENRELASWFEFQLRYKAAEEAGATDTEAHNYAGKNPQTPELWQDGYACGECAGCAPGQRKGLCIKVPSWRRILGDA